jgi:quercetin dioxygenase-like cupin family protein
MKRLSIQVLVSVLVGSLSFVIGFACKTGRASAGESASQPLKVDTGGVKASIQFEAPLAGFLHDLNGKYKLRVTEITIAPGGYVGHHNHLGPGIRKVTAGSMDYIMPGKTVVYRTGTFFFEAGDVSHRVENRATESSVHLLFEILPIDVVGPSLIPPRDRDFDH